MVKTLSIVCFDRTVIAIVVIHKLSIFEFKETGSCSSKIMGIIQRIYIHSIHINKSSAYFLIDSFCFERFPFIIFQNLYSSINHITCVIVAGNQFAINESHKTEEVVFRTSRVEG